METIQLINTILLYVSVGLIVFYVIYKILNLEVDDKK